MFRANLRIIALSISGILLLLCPQVDAQQATKPDVSANLTLMDFTLGKNTLADVQSKLGPSTAGACSHEVEASKMICYISQGPNKAKIFFESGFAGGWSRLDGFKVVSGNLGSTCRLQCATMIAAEDSVQTGGGLKLGMSKRELVALLGPPSKVGRNRLTFEWRSKKEMTKIEADKEPHVAQDTGRNPYWDIQDTIDVTLVGSQVAGFTVHHIVTN
jgi:hypothetical protein